MAKIKKKKTKTTKKRKKRAIRYDDFKINLDLNPDTSREIAAFLIGLLALFILLSMFNLLGPVGLVIKTLLILAFGITAFSIPLILIYYALNAILPEKINLHARQSLSIILLLITIPGILTYLISPDENGISAGGYIGQGITTVSEKLIGIEGTIIFLGTLLIISILLFFNTSLVNALSEVKNSIFRKKYSGNSINKNMPENVNINTYKHEEETEEVPKEKEVPKIISNAKTELTKADVTTTKINADAPVTEPKKEEKAVEIDIDWQLPPLSLLEESKMNIQSGNIDQNVKIIESTLSEFNIDVEMKDVNIGPTVTQYTFKPSTGVKLSKITSLQNDLALSLAAHPIRVEAPIPGKSLVGIEIPNKKAAPVRLKSILESQIFADQNYSIPLPLGRDISGTPTFDDLTKMPHILIAGSTGSGKSVFINTFLVTLLTQYKPDQIKMILVDPKKVELSSYNKLPHLLTPVVTEPTKALNALKWALTEMNDRYQTLSEHKSRNISSYNSKNPNKKLPYIIIVIDELADLMMTAGNDIETSICRLAQMARATGIHLVVATQRPSVDVITGLIKANIATRIAFAVASQIDSRTILDMAGAEKLLGKGDMLYISRETGKPRRIQGAFVSDKEIDAITQFWKNEGPAPDYFSDITSTATNIDNKNAKELFADVDDELIGDVLDLVISTQQASASFLQRKLRVGYARAARLIDVLESKKIISTQHGNKPRQVLIKSLDDLK